MPLFGSAPVTVLEGDYSTWTEISGSPLTFTSIKQLTQAQIDESGNLGLITDNLDYKVALFTIAPPAVISETSDNNIPGTAGMSAWGSILNKYIVYHDTVNVTSVYVYKNGVLVQTITLTFNMNTSGGGGIWVSPSGKYIFAMDRDLKQLHIYKGS